MINWHTFFFMLFATITCAFAVAVVVSANVVRMAVCLIASLAAVTGLYFLAAADFVAAMQLMIYVGGFPRAARFRRDADGPGPLRLNENHSGQLADGRTGRRGAVDPAALRATSVDAWKTAAVAESATGREGGHTVARIGMALLGLRVDALEQPNPAPRGGMAGYLLPFEIISVHLLVVLVGAAPARAAEEEIHRTPLGRPVLLDHQRTCEIV